MLDMDELLRLFITTQSDSLRSDFEFDERAIRMIDDTSSPHDIRVATMASWLQAYGVLRVKGLTGRDAAESILAFADHQRLQVQLSPADIKGEFVRMRDALRQSLPCLSVDGKFRVIDSLSAKALWCCYPSQVPVLDDYAENALCVLSRIMNAPTFQQQTRYSSFVDQWFWLFELVEPKLTDSLIGDFPYKVRVLDRMLWWLGQPPKSPEIEQVG